MIKITTYWFDDFVSKGIYGWITCFKVAYINTRDMECRQRAYN